MCTGKPKKSKIAGNPNKFLRKLDAWRTNAKWNIIIYLAKTTTNNNSQQKAHVNESNTVTAGNTQRTTDRSWL